MKNLVLSIITLVSCMYADAKVSLPQIISDGMIVQRGDSVVLWGNADPGESVVVKAQRKTKGKSYAKAQTQTVADNDGKWIAKLPPMTEGSDYVITIGDITIDPVTPGDVFLCSGQSNMELPVRRVTDMFAEEIASYSNSNIREFAVPNDFEFHKPLDDVKPTAWRNADSENSLNFSALGYFLGRELYELTGVPVGIIRSCWGGTPIESWISEESIRAYPRILNEKLIYEDDAYRADIKKVESENNYRWNKVMNDNDLGLIGDKRWSDPTYDDSSWEVVDLLDPNWGISKGVPVNGSYWFRKQVDIPKDMAGKPGVIRMGCIVDADSVFINGVFVGNTTYQYPPRIYKIPEGLLKEGRNNVTVHVISQNGAPHFVPEKPYKILAGDAEVSLEGKWKYRIGAPMVHGPSSESWWYKPTVLYNAMIYPLRLYPVAGAVWYQGESNVGREQEYVDLLETLMADWRATFTDDDMPFYIVELAEFLHPSDVGGRAAWARMREAQARAANETEGATLIKNFDLGEWNDIHPLNKKTLGKRIADAAYQKMNE